MPLDLPTFVYDQLIAEERPRDGLLHASSHLTAPLRHVQLELAGAPQRPRSVADLITLKTGTLWHRWLEERLHASHLPIMTEVNLMPYLPEGWGGTADYVFWSDAYKAFVLGDLKTIKGAGLPWILSGGAKEDHLWQLSAYWYALRKMGLPLVEGFAVMYLPKDDLPGKNLEPTVMECEMIDEALIVATMQDRKRQVDDYMLSSRSSLAPIPEREAKRVWNAKAKVFDVVLKPHYSSIYCRFEDCGCSDQGQTKIGHWFLVDESIRWKPSRVFEEPPPGMENKTIGDFDALKPALKDFK